MLNRWSLGGFILTKIAKSYGFLDPRMLFSQIQRFSKPSEVWVPAELLRSGMVLQARGLINSQAIQNNLDWVWPFWIHRQFNPKDVAFVPRAFSLTHINLTHRNWTAIGVPDFGDYALVDPRGMVTPFFDSWSLEAWIVKEEGENLIPAYLPSVHQSLHFNQNYQVITFANHQDMSLHMIAEMDAKTGIPTCRISFYGQSETKAWMVICVRPYNPEGISMVDKIERLRDREGWLINGKSHVHLKQLPSGYIFSNYQVGDIMDQVFAVKEPKVLYEEQGIHCPVGMATTGAIFELVPHKPMEVVVEVPLTEEPLKTEIKPSWELHMAGSCALEIPDKHMQSLYEIALRTLVLHAPMDVVYPGPFTYKRFWFRDAAIILYAMTAAGLTQNIEKIINAFPKRQMPSGYYNSQDGEWDANGQAIWAIERYATLTGSAISNDLLSSVDAGARWIKNKLVKSKQKSGHSGLLPAGFSAEHFGPSDFYYWDDFWALAGLRAAATLFRAKDPQRAAVLTQQAEELSVALQESIDSVQTHLEEDGIPPSPYRRMDAGSIGCLISSYPLHIYDANDPSVKATAEFLMKKYLLDGVYYHELSHAGINIYLTLHLAQALLRDGDPRFFDMVVNVAKLATSTGQWPEAIHPQTKGGCMGDGQHVWAAAEWVMMLRNMFVREEEREHTLILGSGIPEQWTSQKQRLFIGPTNTVYGPISVTIETREFIEISWQAQWRTTAPHIKICLPGFESVSIDDATTQRVVLKKIERKVSV